MAMVVVLLSLMLMAVMRDVLVELAVTAHLYSSSSSSSSSYKPALVASRLLPLTLLEGCKAVNQPPRNTQDGRARGEGC